MISDNHCRVNYDINLRIISIQLVLFIFVYYFCDHFIVIIIILFIDSLD